MTKTKRHILIICSQLDLPGGIERAIVNTANLFVSKGNSVSLVILDKVSSSFYPLDTSINVICSNLHFGITTKGNVLSRKLAFFNHIKALKEIILNLHPDIVIATEYPFSIASKLALKNTAIRTYSWEHHHFDHLAKSKFWQLLLKQVYPKLDRVICLNEDEAKLYQAIVCKTQVIPNFITSNNLQQARLESKQLLTIGWLSKTKGTDLIPAIANIIYQKHPDWKWRIIGEGDEYDSLKNASPNIEVVKPSTPDIVEEYLNSSIYVLPSRFECFPMVLLEAMSVGLPAIAFDCPTGPRHIIRNGIDGILVEKENVEAMRNVIINLIDDAEKRKQLGANAFENIQRFSTDAVYNLWERWLFAE